MGTDKVCCALKVDEEGVGIFSPLIRSVTSVAIVTLLFLPLCCWECLGFGNEIDGTSVDAIEEVDEPIVDDDAFFTKRGEETVTWEFSSCRRNLARPKENPLCNGAIGDRERAENEPLFLNDGGGPCIEFDLARGLDCGTWKSEDDKRESLKL